MNSVKKKILILGAAGMAGHMIYQFMKSNNKYEITNTCHKRKFDEESIILDLYNTQEIIALIDKLKPLYIINCTGVLIKDSVNNPANAIYINSYIPHFIARLIEGYNCKLIQLSTDCVFSGRKGNYSPDSVKDASDIYGMSKSLGEILDNRNVTIRTSIIGPELKNPGEGLLDWFMRQNSIVYGYSNVYWSGITTLELAKFIEKVIENDYTGLLQVTNGNKISKYDLLKLFSEIFCKKNLEIKAEGSKISDKSLVPSTNFIPHLIPDYASMLTELREYIILKGNLYNYSY